MVEGLTLMTTTSPFPCRFPTPSRTPCTPLSLFPLGVRVVAPGSDGSHENEWLNSFTFLPEDPVQSAPPVPLAFPVIAPGSTDAREAAVQ